MVTGESGGTIDGGTDWAVSLNAGPEAFWGWTLAFWMGCADATAFKGISFWVRGQSPMSTVALSLQTAETTPNNATPQPGTCVPTTLTDGGNGCVSPSATFPITMAWTQVMLPWSMFSGGSAGASAYTATGNNITGLSFTAYDTYPGVDAGDGGTIYPAMVATVNLQLDDIQFMP